MELFETKQGKRIAELERYNLSLANECAELKEELAQYKNPKNWTRSYNYKGALINKHALYIPKLKGRSI